MAITSPPEQARSLPWWKLALVYPGLLIAVLGAVPTYLDKFNATLQGWSTDRYRAAALENRLWRENLNCAAAPFGGRTLDNKLEVDAQVCPSGNVLVRIKPPASGTIYKWVPLDSNVAPDTQATLARIIAKLSPIGVAQAEGTYEVICQRWVSDGMLERRIRDRQTGQCFTEVVDTRTGRVVSSAPAPCAC